LLLRGVENTNQSTEYKHLIGVDEGLDIFAIHGVGGFVGDILTGFFAASYVPAMDGVNNAYSGGWWERHWVQMGYQLAAACTCAVWSFVISCILLFIINKIPYMHLRVSEEEELRGIDFKYFHDAEEYSGMDIDSYGVVTPGVKETPRSERSTEVENVLPDGSKNEKAA
jgi:Amt family ammonium transporter